MPCGLFMYFEDRNTAMLQNKTAGCIGSDSYLSCISSFVKVKMSFGVEEHWGLTL